MLCSDNLPAAWPRNRTTGVANLPECPRLLLGIGEKDCSYFLDNGPWRLQVDFSFSFVDVTHSLQSKNQLPSKVAAFTKLMVVW